jgi:hypothetical protein
MGRLNMGIALMMEAESTSETSANFYETTRRNSPEDSQSSSYCYSVQSICYVQTLHQGEVY